MSENSMEKKSHVPTVAFTAFGILLILLSSFIYFYALDKFIDLKVSKARELQEGNTMFKLWKKRNGQFTVYFFNVTNTKDIVKGADPVLREIGPYVYEFTKEKVNLIDLDNDTWKFQIKYSTFFNQTASAGSDSDTITMVDFPRVGVINLLQDIFPYSTQENADNFIHSAFANTTSPFKTASVGDFLFAGVNLRCKNGAGMVSNICRLSEAKSEFNIWRQEDKGQHPFKFSFLHYGNMTDPNWYTVDKGMTNSRRSTIFKTIGNKNAQAVWSIKYGNHCNQLDATDDFGYPIKPDDYKLKSYMPPVCRTFELDRSEQEVKYRDVDVKRFEGSSNLYASPDINPNNKCTCHRTINGFKCAPHGFLDIAPCAGLHVLISQPWFLDVDKELWGKLRITKKSMQSEELYRTHMDIEPITGATMIGRKRFQLNMELKRNTAFRELSEIKGMIYPALWVEETAEIDEDGYAEVKKALDGLRIVNIVLYAAMALGILFIVIALFWAKTNGNGRSQNIAVLHTKQ